MMGLLTNRIEREDLKPGDHIYSWRQSYTYAHHGIYVGDGKVIHFTCGGQEIGTGTILDRFIVSSTPPNSGTPCEQCGDQSKLNGVLNSCIDCFLSGRSLYLFHYSVSTAFFLTQARGGTCTLAASDPVDDVLHRANYLLRNGFGTYNIFKNNCEDFAIYCKTGLLVKTNNIVGRSGQLASLLAAGGVLATSPFRLLRTAAFPVVLLNMATAYGMNRYKTDIGVRKDVVKIPVEVLVLETITDRVEDATEAPHED